jgi:hypothetical protein
MTDEGWFQGKNLVVAATENGANRTLRQLG